jgi:hypothetical protein
MAPGIHEVVPGGVKEVAGLAFIVDPRDIAPPILRPVLDYWELKRGARRMPTRHDIEPLELKPYLRHLFLTEALPGDEFRFRLLGSEITERYGRNSTGKTIREVYADQPVIADWLTGMYVAVTTRKLPVLATGTLRALRKEHIFSEALHMPLSDDGESVSMIFGVARYSAPATAAGAQATGT